MSDYDSVDSTDRREPNPFNELDAARALQPELYDLTISADIPFKLLRRVLPVKVLARLYLTPHEAAIIERGAVSKVAAEDILKQLVAAHYGNLRIIYARQFAREDGAAEFNIGHLSRGILSSLEEQARGRIKINLPQRDTLDLMLEKISTQTGGALRV